MAIDRIDIKRVDEKLQKAIEKILKDNPNIKTTTKAVRYACLEHLSQCEEIKNLKEKVSKLTSIVNDCQELNNKYQRYFELQRELLQKG